MGAFGEKLRKQREQRGLALDAISNTTKISTRMLRALEDEHFDQLPGGVFNKGFVRAYARQVGLDEEETITDYLAALRESQVQSQKILPDFRTPGGKSAPITSPDSRHHILPASDHPSGDGGKGNGSHDLPAEERRRNEERRNEVRRNRDRGQNKKAPLTAANLNDARVAAGRDHRETDRSPQIPREHDRPQQAGQVENHRSEERPHHGSSSLPGFITLAPAAESSTESSDDPSPRISRSMLAAALILVLTVGLAVWNSQRHRESGSDSVTKRAVSSNPSSPSLSAQPLAPTLTSASAGSPNIGPASSGAKPSVGKSPAAPPSPSSKASTANFAPKPVANPSVDDSLVAQSSTHALAAKPLTTFTVTIRADQTTWVSITADGKAVATETLIAPAHTSVRAARDVAVRVGNAAGVSFILNGKEFPPQGGVGEVRTYFFDATGLRTMPLSPSPAPNR